MSMDAGNNVLEQDVREDPPKPAAWAVSPVDRRPGGVLRFRPGFLKPRPKWEAEDDIQRLVTCDPLDIHQLIVKS